MVKLKQRQHSAGLLADGVFRFEVTECKDVFGNIETSIKPMFMFCVDRHRVDHVQNDKAY